jgi:hypothetical protein
MHAGLVLVEIIQRAPAVVVAEAFRLILELKNNAERAQSGDTPRVPNALRAWLAYAAEVGTIPRKSTLRAFIAKSPKRWPNMPGPGDGAGWTRLWKASGLAEMEP